VGTITEIYDYLYLLYSLTGEPRCPKHNEKLAARTVSQMVDQILALGEGKTDDYWPLIRERKGEYLYVFDQLRAQGFIHTRVDSQAYELDEWLS